MNRNKWINWASLATKRCCCTSKETLLLSHFLGSSKFNGFGEDMVVLHQEPLQQGAYNNNNNNNEMTAEMIIFPTIPCKSQNSLYAWRENASYAHLHDKLQNQKWILSAPITGENQRIVVFMLFQQKHQSCESIQLGS